MLSRTCLQVEHQSRDIICVCIHPNCSLSRLLCFKCVKAGIHRHESQNNSHILDQEEFEEKIMDCIQQIQNSETKQNQGNKTIISSLKQLIQDIQNQVKNILNLIHYIEEGNSQENQQLQQDFIEIKKHGFSQLSDLSFKNILNILNNQQVNVNVDIHQQLELQSNIIIDNAIKIKELNQSMTYNFQQVQSIKDLKYDINILISSQEQKIRVGFISNDLKYVVSGGQDMVLKVWNYDSCYIIKEIKVDQEVWSAKFTNDSSILYVGYANGLLNHFDLQMNSGQFRNKKSIIKGSQISYAYLIQSQLHHPQIIVSQKLMLN